MMDDEDQGGDPTEAFEALRAEVRLMRRDIAQLAADRSDMLGSKDYDETLGQIMRIVSLSHQKSDAILTSPVLAMTPEQMTARIAAAVGIARQEDQRAIATARTALDDGVRQVHSLVASARLGYEQNRWMGFAAIVGTVFGMFLWAAGAGYVARAMPADWLWPERMAAQTLRLPMWESGQRLMQAASPSAFTGVTTRAVRSCTT